ncbi:MAG TPA: hypothetical protein VF795_01340 [Desulfuromonadaceae bacterium]
MIRNAMLIPLLLLTGCATYATEAGRHIRVVNERDHGQLAECKQLGLVQGKTRTILTGRDYGLFYAINDARNKAALLPGADTLEIGDDEAQGRIFGGEVTGIAYDCNPRHAGHAPRAAAPEIRKAPVAPPPANDIFEKARKCQNKGGVWVNNQCVIPIE